MRLSCDPTPFQSLSLRIWRDHNGYYLTATHTHDGRPLNPCEPEEYGQLSWVELVDLLDALTEEKRPGCHPFGWEQLRLV